MDHQDHVELLRPGVPPQARMADSTNGEPAIWADFGAGSGAFTLALAELLGPGAEIYALDKDSRALQALERDWKVRSTGGKPALHTLHRDFTASLDLPPLDGIVMANALHYLRRKEPFLQGLRALLKPGGRFILVEYNVDRGNLWVPHPISYSTWETLAKRCGFLNTRLLATRPSRFLKEFYSALSFSPG